MGDSPQLERLVHRLRDSHAQAKLVGTARAFLASIAQLPAIARTDAAVLVSGETGTGKELVARAIHYMSDRAPFPFVAVNCGALPDTLLEDELFGHERGAFTDAHQRRKGLVAHAERGTLLLDEVDTLSGRAQIALLRMLQDKKYRPVGTGSELQADVRILSATNAALDRLVERGSFRADLYYRLCVFSIELPPLRERVEDIPTLAAHFIGKHKSEDARPLTLSPEALQRLLAYTWPGNVRELENAIIRGIHLSGGREHIAAGELGLPSPASTPPASLRGVANPRSFGVLKRQAIESFERAYLTQLMSEHQGNISRAARAAGKERRELGKLLKKCHIDPRTFRLST
jgi:DNA-binding NtrC family response regulator